MKYIEDKNELRKKYHQRLIDLKKAHQFIIEENEYWTFFIPKEKRVELPSKGFKIHLSATIYNAITILNMFWDYIKEKTIEWKIMSSFRNLERQNIGFNGYSQIGKFITIYPKDYQEFEVLLNELELLFKFQRSVNIPSDFQYMQSQVVFYRYGDINPVKTNPSDIDLRNRIIPEYVNVPISDYYIKRLNNIPDYLIILEIIKQGGKNSVFKAFDLHLKKLVYLKEAAYLANVDIYGTDSMNRLTIEKRALLKCMNINFTPNFMDDFYVDDHYFIEIENIEAKTLSDFLLDNPISEIKSIINLILNIIELLMKLLDVGVLYIDISFANILIDECKNLYIIDFEYSKLLDEWNHPEIVAGCIGFYDHNYHFIDERRIIFATAALMLYCEYFDNFKEVLGTKDEEKLLAFLQYPFFKNSCLASIYHKAFSHEYDSILEFKTELEKFLRGI